MEKLCYLGDTITCYGGASDATSGRIDNSWKKFRELTWCVRRKAGFNFEATGEDLSVLYYTSFVVLL